MNNILTAIFKDNKYCHVSGLWQYDYGQILRIQGLNLPKAVEIHFSLTESSGDSITRIGTTKDGATDVIIPDSMLENGDTGQNYNIYAFIFLSEIDSGNTEYRIKISVKARPKPEIPGTPEEPELFRETINAVNDAADRAETAERNAKVSEEAAAEHAKKTEGSVTELDTAREKALKEINDKKAEGVNAVVKQKETSEQSVTEHTDREIQRVTRKANEISNSLNKSITEASNKKSALDESVNTSVETKKQLDLSIESGKKTKADLDQSIENSKNAKSNLDGSVEEANTIKTELAEAVETASTLDGSLGIKIEEGKQVEKNIVASGEKAVEDINTTGAEKLKVMQDIAEEFAADREQIDINQNNISSLKEDIAKLNAKENGSVTANYFDISNDNRFTEHTGLLAGYDSITYDANILTDSQKYLIYRTLEIPLSDVGILKIKKPKSDNIGVAVALLDLTRFVMSTFVSANASDLSGNYSSKYISSTSADEWYEVNISEAIKDGYKKIYICYLEDEKPYIKCDSNYKPKWLYDYTNDIEEVRKLIENGNNTNGDPEVIYDVSNPDIYNQIYSKTSPTFFENGKLYVLKVYVLENVTNANISINSEGSSSSKFKVFVEGEPLAKGEHSYHFVFDAETYSNQYLRVYLDGSSSKCGKIEIIDNNVSIKTRLDKKMDYTIATVNMFNSIGAIGDSYTAGSTKHSDGTWTKEREHSYIATMAKRAGIDWNNYGVPGASTRTYLSGVDGDVGIDNVLSANANDFYFFALGINDVGMLGLDYLGTIADITSSYTDNPDTFFGNYARIIEMVMEHAPKAKFCLIKPPFKSGNYPTFRGAIEQIANHYEAPFIDLLDDPAMSSSVFLAMSDEHPTLAGYSAMGLACERLFSKMVEKNVEYFRYATVG